MSYKSLCAVKGVTANGVKEGKFGLALIRASGTAAGVFTANLAKAAPIELMRKQIKKGKLDAIISNSGCANAYTGKRGYEDAVTMTEYAGSALGVDSTSVGVASTGVIGRFLDMPLIRRQCADVAMNLTSTPDAEDRTVRAIMTTDIRTKHALVKSEDFTLGAIAKGSGMIAPNMGTMIAFICTDALVDAKSLKEALKLATIRTFNRVVVDGDMSTNDIALCIATGESGKVNPREFSDALEKCCRSLAQQIAADGEGASKLLEVTVRGAPKEAAAAKVARVVIESPLVKTAVYGEDPNWGRVIAAAGAARVNIDPETWELFLGGQSWVERGAIEALSEAEAHTLLEETTIEIRLDLGQGAASATGWGCDLSSDYVRINAHYRT